MVIRRSFSRISRHQRCWQNLGRMENQDHKASIIPLALEAHYKAAPEALFVHNFPGAVKFGIAHGSIGGLIYVLKTIFAVLCPLVCIPLKEAGDRHIFFCTSARFSTGPEDATAGAPLVNGLALVRDTNGQMSSCVYLIGANGESVGPKVKRLLAQLRSQGIVEWLWENIESDINGAIASSKCS